MEKINDKLMLNKISKRNIILLTVIIINLVSVKSLQGQVLETTIDSSYFKDYPFIENKITIVRAQELDGSLGYFILKMKIEKLDNYLLDKFKYNIKILLDENKAYENKCFNNFGERKDLINQRLILMNAKSEIESENKVAFKSIYNFNTDLEICTKKWFKCKETNYKYNYNLITFFNNTNLYFEFEKSVLKFIVKNNTSVMNSFNDCMPHLNFLFSRYNPQRSIQKEYSSLINLSQLIEHFPEIINTKNIKIINYQQYYYVYFIQKI